MKPVACAFLILAAVNLRAVAQDCTSPAGKAGHFGIMYWDGQVKPQCISGPGDGLPNNGYSTVELWVRLEQPLIYLPTLDPRLDQTDLSLVELRDANDQLGWALRIKADPQWGAPPGALYVQVRGSSGPIAATGSLSWIQDQWYHVA